MKDSPANLISEDDREEVSPRDSQQPFVLALDVGSSSARAIFYDAQARAITGTLARVERGFVTTADGGSEMDAEEALAGVTRVLDEALQCAPPEIISHTKAVAVSCFWHSLVGVDAEGRALTPVLGWADTRAAGEAAELRHQLDERATHRRVGCRFHPSYWPAKLRWLKKTRAEIYQAVNRWMSFGEFLALRLSGEVAASVSMASGTGLLDQRRCVWDEELLAQLSVGIEHLPPLAGLRVDTFSLAGEYADRWPQLRRCKLFPAIGDGVANNIGAGCVSRERISLMIGTSGAMRVAYDGEAPAELPSSLWCYRADRRRVVVGGALSDGGGLHDWMTDTLALNEDAKAVERALTALEPNAHDLTVLPFWAGERSTGWHPEARGAILGLTTHTRPLEILQASMEAVAYRIALLAAELEPYAPGAEVRASGGALWASSFWTQMLADVMNRPVKISRVREASSRGAVLLALEALGAIKSLDELPASVGQTFTPDAKRHARYREGLERQQKFYELLVSNQETSNTANTEQ